MTLTRCLLTISVMHPKARALTRLISCILGSAMLFGVTGCETARECSLTYRLWNNSEMRRFYEPAPSPRLELYHAGTQGDVMAVYDEAHETRSAIRRRAYYVNRSRLRIEAGHKPRFVNPELVRGLPAVPRTEIAAPGAPAPAAVQAFVAPDGQQFTLSGDFGNHTYHLPVYEDRSGVAGRVLLSPFAVTGDVVMVGLVTGVVAAYFWAAGGGYCGR